MCNPSSPRLEVFDVAKRKRETVSMGANRWQIKASRMTLPAIYYFHELLILFNSIHEIRRSVSSLPAHQPAMP